MTAASIPDAEACPRCRKNWHGAEYTDFVDGENRTVRGCLCGATWLPGTGLLYREEEQPVLSGEISALKAVLEKDHAKRRRKYKHWGKHDICACGFIGLVDYLNVDLPCLALKKLIRLAETRGNSSAIPNSSTARNSSQESP